MDGHKRNQTQASVNRLKRFNAYIAAFAAKEQTNFLGKPSQNYVSDTTFRCEVCGRTPAIENAPDEFLCREHSHKKF
jgi:hypothetical protein